MWKEKGRAVIYEMAGIYLLVKAVNLFQNRAQSSGGEYGLILVFIALFIIAGIALIGAGMYIVKKHSGTGKASAIEEDTEKEKGNRNKRCEEKKE